MKIGILYLGTGRYICFWEEFYKSALEFLFKNHEVHFFVITDAPEIAGEGEKNVRKYYYDKMKWPFSAKKYEALLKAKVDAQKMDYLYYFNGNMKFVGTIGDEIIPSEEHGYFAICEWVNYTNGNPDKFPYDRNPECWANIPLGQGKYYFMGGLHGGRSKEYLKMCEELDAVTKADVARNVIAVCHDESYINKFMLNKNPLVISSNYALPQGWKIEGPGGAPKALVLKKHHYKYGGHSYLRGDTDKKITPLKWWLNKVFGLKLT